MLHKEFLLHFITIFGHKVDVNVTHQSILLSKFDYGIKRDSIGDQSEISHFLILSVIWTGNQKLTNFLLSDIFDHT